MRSVNQRLHTIPLICVFDNDEIDRSIYIGMMKRFLEENGMEAEICEIRTDDEFSRQMNEQVPDIVLLDMNLPGRHGIEVARDIRQRSRTAQIIFVSKCNEFAAEAFEVEALSYLKKPIDYARFKCAMDRAMSLICRSQSLTVNDDREKKTIYVDDIIYMETQNRKLTFHLREDLVEAYISLARALEMLPRNRFVQISRFTAVALRHIHQMNESEVIMQNRDVLPLSPKMALNAYDLYSAYRMNNATV